MVLGSLALLLCGQQGVWKPNRTLVRVEDLPKPYATKSRFVIPRATLTKNDAPLKAPPGFKVNVFASGLHSPRWLAVAPNGDVFCVECYKGQIILLRDKDGTGRAEFQTVFASKLDLPFGIAFHDGYLYVANTGSVVRFRYQDGQLKAEGPPETVIGGIPKRGYNQHWTRNLIFTPDGKKMYLSIGSETNKKPDPLPRAAIMQYNPDGSGKRVIATGLRNPVGMAFHPGTNQLWATCVERDYMGDDVVPDFVTRIKEGQFYGWPWYYIGKNRDPKTPLAGAPKKPVTVPDVLVTAHSVPLGLMFYTGTQFPAQYRNDLFVAMRGSTNRPERSGNKVVRIHFQNGKLVPGYEDFITGWVPNARKKDVYGRPVGLAMMQNGSMLIADEAGHRIYRVTYTGH